MSNEKVVNKQRVGLAVAFALLTLMAGPAFAFTAPAAGDFGYDIYEVVIINILGGPIGWVGAAALVVFGATKVMTQWMLTVMCVVAATIIVKISGILTSLGAMI